MYNNAYRTGFSGPTLSIGMGTGFGPGMGMGYGGYGGGFYMGGPGMYYGGFPGYYPYQATTKIKVTYFKSLLQEGDLAHVQGSLSENMKEKINQFEYNKFRYNTPEVVRIAKYNDQVLYGYYAKTGKKFVLICFRR
jgi:hypothetical protein